MLNKIAAFIVGLGIISFSLNPVSASAHSCSGHSAKSSDVLHTVAAKKELSTLLSAIQVAGLSETLRTGGPFTVFAPSNEAFAKLPKADLDKLLKDPERLASVLTLHVVPREILAEEVIKLDSAKSVQGSVLVIRSDGDVTVNGAKVTKTDIEASNGVIHLIDTVILPQT